MNNENYGAGILSIAVAFPDEIRSNQYYRDNHSDSVALAEQYAMSVTSNRLPETGEPNPYLETGAPYIAQAFRGTMERRTLSIGESTLTLLQRAATDALAAATISVAEIDAMIVASSWSEQIVPGDAISLAKCLNLNCLAWNVESTCSSGMVALQNACALVQSGAYRNVLIVVATAYSRFTNAKDPASYLLGDGAGGIVVGRMKSGKGILGTKFLNTRETIGTVFNEFTLEPNGRCRSYIKMGKNPDEVFASTIAKYLLDCCYSAVETAAVTLDQIRFFGFMSPVPWYAKACAQVLGIDTDRTINLAPLYANIGMVFPIANLFHAAYAGKIAENDLVLIYSFAFSGSAAASVMRWGDVALGPPPAPPKDPLLLDDHGQARLDVLL